LTKIPLLAQACFFCRREPAHLGGEGGEVDEDVGELVVPAVEEQTFKSLTWLCPSKWSFPDPGPGAGVGAIDGPGVMAFQIGSTGDETAGTGGADGKHGQDRGFGDG
jgi:hypothetical protein